MQDDPFRYWQHLTENYRQMSDGELLELAAKPEDLTEVAQQVLRDEMKKRRLDETIAQLEFPRSAPPRAAVHWEPVNYRNAFSVAPKEENDEDHEYTWKVLLSECNSQAQAWQLAEALRRAGIESWIQALANSDGVELVTPKVLVAADQLEQARLIAAQPIPADIIEESQIELPEFALPICPHCGSKDGAALESADPVNAWFCEACGAEWTDSEIANNEGADGEKSSAH